MVSNCFARQEMYGISIVPQKPLADSQDFTKCFQPHNVPMPTDARPDWKIKVKGTRFSRQWAFYMLIKGFGLNEFRKFATKSTRGKHSWSASGVESYCIEVLLSHNCLSINTIRQKLVNSDREHRYKRPSYLRLSNDGIYLEGSGS